MKRPRNPECHEVLLAEIDDFNRDIELTRENRARMKLRNERGRQTETFKAAGVKNQLGIE